MPCSLRRRVTPVAEPITDGPARSEQLCIPVQHEPRCLHTSYHHQHAVGWTDYHLPMRQGFDQFLDLADIL